MQMSVESIKQYGKILPGSEPTTQIETKWPSIQYDLGALKDPIDPKELLWYLNNINSKLSVNVSYYHVPGTFLSTLHVLAPLIYMLTLQDRKYSPLFQGATEAESLDNLPKVMQPVNGNFDRWKANISLGK